MKILYLPNEYSQQRQRQKKAWVYPVRMAMEAEYNRKHGHEVFWESGPENPDLIIKEPEGIPFNNLPIPNRVFTKAFDKKYQRYGNYKYHPATHMQVADGCWHGKCSFCIENTKGYITRPLDAVFEEISRCHALGFKEIFDDSGTFPQGEWMEKFCKRMIASRRKIVLGCNMRIGADVDFELMKAAGFRMVLFGIESANQKTLFKIKKGIEDADIIYTIRKAAGAGLEPHIAIMLGYPWETEVEENNTIDLVHFLLRKGYAKTAQASLFNAKGHHAIDRGNINRIYSVAKYGDFWCNKFKDIKNWEDMKYFFKSIRKGIMRD